ncbi:hypothetical protein VCHENC01_0131 [Vibrio harveyi]|nr:hypothetical protein VCHENC01_0131 [Vibrio harveyi]
MFYNFLEVRTLSLVLNDPQYELVESQPPTPILMPYQDHHIGTLPHDCL